MRTGLMWETWKVGWAWRVPGSLRRTATGFITFSMANGPTNLGDSFFESDLSGRSLEESHTLSPTAYVGAGMRLRLEWSWHRPEALSRDVRARCQEAPSAVTPLDVDLD